MAHRPQATARSLKWLIGILDNILKQVDASQKKASKMSLPELAFGGFQRKYGELMASEYMASLVNTVAKYRLVRFHTFGQTDSALILHGLTGQPSSDRGTVTCRLVRLRAINTSLPYICCKAYHLQACAEQCKQDQMI